MKRRKKSLTKMSRESLEKTGRMRGKRKGNEEKKKR